MEPVPPPANGPGPPVMSSIRTPHGPRRSAAPPSRERRSRHRRHRTIRQPHQGHPRRSARPAPSPVFRRPCGPGPRRTGPRPASVWTSAVLSTGRPPGGALQAPRPSPTVRGPSFRRRARPPLRMPSWRARPQRRGRLRPTERFRPPRSLPPRPPDTRQRRARRRPRRRPVRPDRPPAPQILFPSSVRAAPPRGRRHLGSGRPGFPAAPSYRRPTVDSAWWHRGWPGPLPPCPWPPGAKRPTWAPHPAWTMPLVPRRSPEPGRQAAPRGRPDRRTRAAAPRRDVGPHRARRPRRRDRSRRLPPVPRPDTPYS